MYQLRVCLALLLTALLVIGGAGCGDDITVRTTPARTDVTAVELQTMMADGKPLVLLDVRSTGEYAAGHIEGSINVQLSALKTWGDTQAPRTRIACICWSGVRSRAAADQLVAMGFTDVYNLQGGLSVWPGGLVT